MRDKKRTRCTQKGFNCVAYAQPNSSEKGLSGHDDDGDQHHADARNVCTTAARFIVVMRTAVHKMHTRTRRTMLSKFYDIIIRAAHLRRALTARRWSASNCCVFVGDS